MRDEGEMNVGAIARLPNEHRPKRYVVYADADLEVGKVVNLTYSSEDDTYTMQVRVTSIDGCRIELESIGEWVNEGR